MDLGLKAKRAVVTGGSRGIGRAIAECFAAEGANVSICARKADEVAQAVEALKARPSTPPPGSLSRSSTAADLEKLDLVRVNPVTAPVTISTSRATR